MRQSNILRNSSKFKIRILKPIAKLRLIEKRLLQLPRRRVSVQRKLLPLPILMMAPKTRKELRLRNKKLQLPTPLPKTKTASDLLPLTAKARKSKTAILMRRCARSVVLS